jgi:hypothetical protein
MLLPHLMAGGLAALLVFDWQRERGVVATLARGIAAEQGSDLEVVLSIAHWINVTLPLREDPIFLTRVLGPLGGAPSAIIEHGGCCSGRARLLILACGALGHLAAQVTLYDRTGRAKHCLVEVRLREGTVLVDPTYDLYYRGPSGALIGLDPLRRGTQPVLVALRSNRPAAYPTDAYYNFDYLETKTANWTKSRARRVIYRVVHPLTLGRIDTVRLPVLLEYPHILLAAMICPCYALLIALV